MQFPQIPVLVVIHSSMGCVDFKLSSELFKKVDASRINFICMYDGLGVYIEKHPPAYFVRPVVGSD